MKARSAIPFLVLLGLLASTSHLATPAVSVHPGLETAGFAERWSWGESELRSPGWVGYAVGMWTEPDRHFLSGSITIRGSRGIWMKGEPLDELLGEAAAAGSGVPPDSRGRPALLGLDAVPRPRRVG